MNEDTYRDKLNDLQLEVEELRAKLKESREGDTISRQAAIRWVKTECNPYGKPTLDFESGKKVIEHLKQMPSAQPERLTDDDFETIRIHLNAYKENLCNQQRWKEAEEYQRLIDRFMAFASAQPEIVRCKDCKHKHIENMVWTCPFGLPGGELFFCAYGAERRTDEL